MPRTSTDDLEIDACFVVFMAAMQLYKLPHADRDSALRNAEAEFSDTEASDSTTGTVGALAGAGE